METPGWKCAVRVGGAGASPLRPLPQLACPVSPSQAQEAQGLGRGRTFWGDPPARKVAGKLWLAAELGDAEAVPAPSSLVSPFGAWSSVPLSPGSSNLS